MAQKPAKEPGDGTCFLDIVVDTVDQRDFERNSAVGCLDVPLAGGEERRDRVSTVDRDEAFARSIARRVKRDREVHLQAFVRETVDSRDDPGG